MGCVDSSDLSKITYDELLAEIKRRQTKKYPEPICSLCSLPESEDEHGILTDLRVIIANGEEGHADITQWLCHGCLCKQMLRIMALGFVDHRHGGINYLEASACGGYGHCLTPTEYGRVYVNNYEYNGT